MEEKQLNNGEEKRNFYWSVKLDLFLLYKLFPDITPSEAILMYFLRDLCFSKSNRLKKIVKDGKEYVWITYNHIIEQVPILHIKTRSGMKKLMDRIFKRGLFEYIFEDGKIFISPTEKIDMLTFVPLKSVNYRKQGVNSSYTHPLTPGNTPLTVGNAIYNNNQYNYNQNNYNQYNKQSFFKKIGDVKIFHCPVCGRDYPESMSLQISPHEWICKDCHLQKRKKMVEFNKKKKTTKKVPLNVDQERVMAYKEKTGGRIVSDKDRSKIDVMVSKAERRLKSDKISEMDFKY
jgi:hypothetical protein